MNDLNEYKKKFANYGLKKQYKPVFNQKIENKAMNLDVSKDIRIDRETRQFIFVPRNLDIDKLIDKQRRIDRKNSIKDQRDSKNRAGRFQMLEVFGGIAAAATTYAGVKVAKGVDDLKNTVNEAKEPIMKLIQTVNTMIESSAATLKMFVTKTFDAVRFVKDFVFLLINYFLADNKKKIYSLILNFTRLIVDNTSFVSFDFMKLFKDMSVNIEDETVECEFQSGNLDVPNIVKIVSSMLCVFLSVLFLQKLPGKDSFESLFNRLGVIGKNVSGIKSLYDTFGDILSVVIDFVRYELMKIPKEYDLDKFVTGYGAWMNEVETLLERDGESLKCEAIYSEPKFVIKIENMYKRGLEISREMVDYKVPNRLMTPYMQYMKFLTDIFKKCDVSGAFGNKPRVRPLVIWLFGESQVGKSGLTWPLSIDLNNNLMSDKEEAKNFSKHIYFRNVEQEFWDNYMGQNIVCYDDFGQLRDSQSNPNSEYMELIRAVNIAPYPLHMANLEDKRKTKFTSKVLILTSNIIQQEVNSLTFPDAVPARVDICAKIRNGEEWQKEGWSATSQRNVMRLDKQKVYEKTGQPISTQVYEIDLYDAETKRVTKTNLTYEEFLNHCVDIMKCEHGRSTQFTNYLTNYAHERFGKFQTQDFEYQERPKLIDLEEFLKQDNKSMVSNSTRTIKEWVDNLWDSVKRSGEAGFLVCLDGTKTCTLKMTDFYCSSKEMFTMYIGSMCDSLSYARDNMLTGIKQASSRMWDEIIVFVDKLKKSIVEHPYITLTALCLGFVSMWYFMRGKPSVKTYHPKIPNFKVLADSVVMTHVLLPEFPIYPTMKNFDDEVFLEQLEEMTTIFTLANIDDAQDVAAQMHNTMLRNKIDRNVILLICKPDTMPVKRIIEMTNEVRRLVYNYFSLGMTEMVSSADAVTLKKKSRVVVESMVTGNAKPLMEMVSSADSLTRQKKAVPILEYSANMQYWTDKSANLLIANRVLKNQYIMTMMKDGLPKARINVLFVKGVVAITAAHVKLQLDRCDSVELENVFGVRFEVPREEIEYKRVVNSINEEKEVCGLIFPKYVMAHCDIVKHFQERVSLALVSRPSCSLPTLRETKGMMLPYIHTTRDAYCGDRPIMLNDTDMCHKSVVRDVIYYKAPTTAGDCGSPLIVNENKITCKILGIHVAALMSGEGITESVTQKDLNRLCNTVEAKFQIALDEDTLPNSTLIDVELECDRELDILELFKNFIPSQKFNPISKCLKSPSQPVKTDIEPSLIHGMIDTVVTKPAYLRNVKRNGEYINVRNLNLKKAAMDTPYIPTKLIDQAIMNYKPYLFKNTNEDLRKVFSLTEVVEGLEDLDYITATARNTSPGYPWNLESHPGYMGKTFWLGRDSEFYVHEDVQVACSKIESNARKGKRTPVVWIDTLKDERRPIAKVDEGKTRVFAAGPMDYTLVFRKYFIGFIANIMENRISNEQSVGTNVYSMEWKRTALKLQSKGKKVIAGDFSTFDGTLNSCIISKMVDLINEWYDDGDENALIRETLFKEIYNSIHLQPDTNIFYQWTHSQPSGCPLTTVLNSLYNSISMRVVYILCGKKFGYGISSFNDNVSMVSYGDDNCVNISDEVVSWFNQRTITEGYAQIGMIYTDETKGKEQQEFRSIHEIQYLKRNFIYDNVKKTWEAPLDLTTILEMPNWIRDSTDKIEATKINSENAIMELSMHPQCVFDKWVKIISKAFYKETRECLEFNTYFGYFDERWEKYFN